MEDLSPSAAFKDENELEHKSRGHALRFSQSLLLERTEQYAKKTFSNRLRARASFCIAFEFAGAGEANRDAHRRLSVWQLSVQYPEGREPSRLRTQFKRDSNH